MELGILIVGYSVCYLFHVLSFGYLFRFVEFEPYSFFLVECGCYTVDLGGPNKQGFSHGRMGHEINFPTPIFERPPGYVHRDGGGGDGGDGDG